MPDVDTSRTYAQWSAQKRTQNEVGVGEEVLVAEVLASLWQSSGLAARGVVPGWRFPLWLRVGRPEGPRRRLSAAATPAPVRVRVGQAVASNDEGCGASS